MKKISLMSGILLGLSACTQSDIPTEMPNETNKNDETFYFSIDIKVPGQTRSRSTTETGGNSSDGTVDGFDNENKVNTAQIYLFDTTSGENLLSLSTETTESEIIESGNISIYAEVSLSQIKKVFSSDEANLYIIANSPLIDEEMIEEEEDFQNALLNVSSLNSSTGIVRPFKMNGQNGYACPMTNSSYYTLDLSSISVTEDTEDEDLFELVRPLFNGTYRTQSGKKVNLWDLSKNKGPLLLERAVARVDYKNAGSSAPVFNLDNAIGPNGETVQLRLVGMQLFNVSKESFVFRHTSNGNLTNGLKDNESGGVIFNNENSNSTLNSEVEEEDGTSYRWIYDTDWENKVAENVNEDELTITSSNYFLNQSLLVSTEEDEVVNWGISLEQGDDLTNGYISYEDLATNASLATSNRGFLPWHYITENTLPSVNMMEMPFSTGVAFYLEVILKDQNGVEVTLSKDNPITINMRDGDYQSPVWMETGTEENSEGYYYFTYRYLIEHNNNNSGTVSGNTGNKEDKAPMQIGIVRNNVYQLSIEKIEHLPDPDHIDNFYLQIKCEVMPWDVRFDDEITLY